MSTLDFLVAIVIGVLISQTLRIRALERDVRRLRHIVAALEAKHVRAMWRTLDGGDE